MLKPIESDTKPIWYVMQITKRHYRPEEELAAMRLLGIETFSPTEKRTQVIAGKRIVREYPILSNLFFAKGLLSQINDAIAPTLGLIQFKYQKGGWLKRMIVPEQEMENFKKAIENSKEYDYLTEEQINALPEGAMVRITGGPMWGVEGKFARVLGHKRRSLIVSINGFLTASIEVSPDVVEVVKQ